MMKPKIERLPDELRQMIGPASWHQNNIGHSATEVYKLTDLEIAESAYLKISKQESLQGDKNILQWLEDKLPVPKVHAYIEEFGYSYLLMSEIKGQHGATREMLKKPEVLVSCYAKGLRAIHAVAIKGCPFDQRLEKKLQQAQERIDRCLVDEDDFEEQYKGYSSEELFRKLEQMMPESEDIVFAHGDYCLPNIIIQNKQVSGFIDLGRAGLADRYQDIALAIRSLHHNGLADWVNEFLHIYGIRSVDQEKVDFYILLDEFF